MQETEETRVPSPGQEDRPEKEMATHSSTLAGKIPRTEEPGQLQCEGLQRVGHNLVTEQQQRWCAVYRGYTQTRGHASVRGGTPEAPRAGGNPVRRDCIPTLPRRHVSLGKRSCSHTVLADTLVWRQKPTSGASAGLISKRRCNAGCPCVQQQWQEPATWWAAGRRPPPGRALSHTETLKETRPPGPRQGRLQTFPEGYSSLNVLRSSLSSYLYDWTLKEKCVPV